mmetsp:Transcript_14543/g.38405  ORF Transcript_14543/g.38405 Transcript_14543/m.38405 type:complete len:250 (-) Transcript_14543:300-1049(-)
MLLLLLFAPRRGCHNFPLLDAAGGLTRLRTLILLPRALRRPGRSVLSAASGLTRLRGRILGRLRLLARLSAPNALARRARAGADPDKLHRHRRGRPRAGLEHLRHGVLHRGSGRGRDHHHLLHGSGEDCLAAAVRVHGAGELHGPLALHARAHRAAHLPVGLPVGLVAAARVPVVVSLAWSRRADRAHGAGLDAVHDRHLAPAAVVMLGTPAAVPLRLHRPYRLLELDLSVLEVPEDQKYLVELLVLHL